MAGTGPTLPPLQHPADTPVTLGGLHGFLQDEQYVTEARMREIVGQFVQEQVHLFQTLRTPLVGMVVGGHIDGGTWAMLTGIRHLAMKVRAPPSSS